MLGEWDFGRKVRCEIPVMPTVVTAEHDLVSTRCSSGNTDCHGIGLTSTLAEPDHFGTGYQCREQLRSLQFERMVNAEAGSPSGLVLNSSHDRGIRMPQKHRPGAHVEVNVFVAIHIPKMPTLLLGTINWRDA